MPCNCNFTKVIYQFHMVFYIAIYQFHMAFGMAFEHNPWQGCVIDLKQPYKVLC